MVAIVLTILKVIGIIFLSILGLLLLVTGTVLFCPIRYRIRGNKQEESNVHAVIDVTWILRILRFHGYYQEGKEFEYYFKVLFFRVFPKSENPNLKRKRKRKTLQKTADENTESSDKANQHRDDEKVLEENEQQQTIANREKDSRGKEKSCSNVEEQKKKQQSEIRKKSQGLSGAEEKTKRKKIFYKIKDKIEHIRNVFRKMCDKVKELLSNYEKFREFIARKDTQEALKFLNQQRKYLIRYLKPDKFQVKINYGMENPAHTGEILAVYSVLAPFLPGVWNVVPDFEQVCFNGEVNMKGKIRLFRLLLVGWRCYKNETIRKFIPIGK